MKFHIARAYLPTLQKHWVSWTCALIAMIGGTSLGVLVPYYLKDIVNVFTGDNPNADDAMAKLVLLALVVLSCQTIYRLFDISLMLHESRAMNDLDNRSFYHIQRQSPAFFEDEYAGSLTEKLRRFRSSYETIMDLFFFQFGKNFVMFIVFSVAFSMTLPYITLPFILWVFVFIASCVGIAVWKYPYDTYVARRGSDVSATATDSFASYLAVKTFGRERAESAHFADVTKRHHTARLQSWMRDVVASAVQWTIISIGQIGLIYLMIQYWKIGRANAGDFVFAQAFMLSAVFHLVHFGGNLRRLFAAVAEAEEMAHIYHRKPEVQDAPGARTLIVEDGEVEFHCVSFHYGENLAINDFSLHISPGQSVGLVGKSGAGKSTLVKLLMRFYDLDAGYIRIDRQDIANVTQISLRQQLAVVPQQSALFHRSIRENIAFACPNASEEETIDAARRAHAWEFISRLPDGMDTVVGERGIKLSGGQQQRIAIARSILADPRMLILDEATSSQDSETEMYIQDAISNLLHGRTAIVIAHRLSTIMRLDRIVVMDAGHIVETGTHEELISDTSSLYARLWQQQRNGYIS